MGSPTALGQTAQCNTEGTNTHKNKIHRRRQAPSPRTTRPAERGAAPRSRGPPLGSRPPPHWADHGLAGCEGRQWECRRPPAAGQAWTSPGRQFPKSARTPEPPDTGEVFQAVGPRAAKDALAVSLEPPANGPTIQPSPHHDPFAPALPRAVAAAIGPRRSAPSVPNHVVEVLAAELDWDRRKTPGCFVRQCGRAWLSRSPATTCPQ